MMDGTIKFTIPGDDSQNMRYTLRCVFDALLSEDPTYITNYNNARSMITKLDRDEVMQELVRCYLFGRK